MLRTVILFEMRRDLVADFDGVGEARLVRRVDARAMVLRLDGVDENEAGVVALRIVQAIRATRSVSLRFRPRSASSTSRPRRRA